MVKNKLLNYILSIVLALSVCVPSVSATFLQNPVLNSKDGGGLSATPGSAIYTISEVERHFHSWERWFEVAAVPSGETHVADRIGDNGGTSFQADAGNDDWGTAVQILGSDDTPAIAGNVKFNTHRVFITATERTDLYYVQIIFGTSAAAGLSAGTYTEFPFLPAGNQGDATALTLNTRRVDVGTKVWFRVKCPGQNTATLDLLVGIHGYEG